MKNLRNNKQILGQSGRIAKFVLSFALLISWVAGFAKEYHVNSASSTLVWEAKKVTGQHVGTISFGDGTLNIEHKKITGGKVVVDMNTIVDTDLTDAGYNQKLIGHLKSDDFFGVAKYPQATLEIKSVVPKSTNLYHFTADLTIKGITSPVEFDAEVTDLSDQVTATGTMVVDRTKYGIKYGSGSFFQGLGDKVIYDDFTLKFKLVAVNK